MLDLEPTPGSSLFQQYRNLLSAVEPGVNSRLSQLLPDGLGGSCLYMSMDRQSGDARTMTWLTLFASTGTLICCALPILLVTLGLGATVAALSSAFPFLIVLSEHKIWVFTFSGFLLGLAGWMLFRTAKDCPADLRLGALCARTQVWNRRIYWSSVVIWCAGFFAAYLALPLRIWLESWT